MADADDFDLVLALVSGGGDIVTATPEAVLALAEVDSATIGEDGVGFDCAGELDSDFGVSARALVPVLLSLLLPGALSAGSLSFLSLPLGFLLAEELHLLLGHGQEGGLGGGDLVLHAEVENLSAVFERLLNQDLVRPELGGVGSLGGGLDPLGVLGDRLFVLCGGDADGSGTLSAADEPSGGGVSGLGLGPHDVLESLQLDGLLLGASADEAGDVGPAVFVPLGVELHIERLLLGVIDHVLLVFALAGGRVDGLGLVGADAHIKRDILIEGEAGDLELALDRSEESDGGEFDAEVVPDGQWIDLSMVAAGRGLDHDAGVLVPAGDGGVDEPRLLLIHEDALYVLVLVPIGEAVQDGGPVETEPDGRLGELLVRVLEREDRLLAHDGPHHFRFVFNTFEFESLACITVVDALQMLGKSTRTDSGQSGN